MQQEMILDLMINTGLIINKVTDFALEKEINNFNYFVRNR